MPSATNERQIKAREARETRNRLDDKLVMEGLMSSSVGRAWVSRRIAEGEFFSANQALDPYWMAFEKGIRWAMLRILKDAQGFCPREFVTMMEEQSSVTLHDSAPQEDRINE